DVLVLRQAADLLLKEVGRAEEKLALHMYDRDLGVGALGRVAKLRKVSAFIDCVLDKGWRARRLEEERERDSDSDVNGGVEPQEKTRSQGHDKDDQIRRRRPAGDPYLVPV